MRLLEKSREMDPFVEHIDQYLGDAYLAAGDREKGCLHLAEAVKLGDLEEKERSQKCR